MNANSAIENSDVVLVGAGIMSATLGILLKELQPDLTMQIFETLDVVAGESSDAWNNAGTGHAALCELNYTPQLPDGSVDCAKAFEINEAFELSRQLWSFLVREGRLPVPGSFIQRIPHLSFVRGAADVAYLKKRYEALSRHHLFRQMQFSEDRAELMEWMPLVMEGRSAGESVAATKIEQGSDVNFGALARGLFQYLKGLPGVSLNLLHEVRNLYREPDDRWIVEVQDKVSKTRRAIRTKFAFLGAGGGALPLLQKSGLPEGKGYGGFPVSGQWLRCLRPELVERHHAKVYGKAAIGSPPMSVPHLDTRMIDGKKGLLFGPFAGFTTKYLRNGSPLDFPLAIKPDNFVTMTAAGLQNVELTRYLIGQVLQSPADRMRALREFYPAAQPEDWHIELAGQRVQVVKKHGVRGGVLYFGTEVIFAYDGSIAALLGASPGASTSVSIMLDVLQNCFFDQMRSDAWQAKLQEMIPSYRKSLIDDAGLYHRLHSVSTEILGLQTEVHA